MPGRSRPSPCRWPWPRSCAPQRGSPQNNQGSVRGLPGCAGCQHGDPHLCCADGECAPSLWGIAEGLARRRGARCCCLCLTLGIPLQVGPACWRRGRAHALHWVPELPKGIYLFALGKLSSVRRQQVLPSQVRSLLNTGHLTLAFTKHLRPDPALCYSHREDKDGPWAESKIWITAIKIQVSLQFLSPFSCMCFMLSSWTHMCLCPLHRQLETASYKETRERQLCGLSCRHWPWRDRDVSRMAHTDGTFPWHRQTLYYTESSRSL